jgi:hypothetical protein
MPHTQYLQTFHAADMHLTCHTMERHGTLQQAHALVWEGWYSRGAFFDLMDGACDVAGLGRSVVSDMRRLRGLPEWNASHLFGPSGKEFPAIRLVTSKAFEFFWREYALAANATGWRITVAS